MIHVLRAAGLAAWAAILLVLAGGPATAQERRVALVVGNGAYAQAARLENAPRDAAAMAQALRGTGFDVEVVTDVTRSALEQALRRFSRRADGADVALFFYAGHGVQASDVNYLLPTDAQLERAEDLRFDAVELPQVMAVMQGARMRLVFLDACRNNPLADRLASRSRSVSRGLARVDTVDAGALVAFATAPGTTADDGRDGNSPFTAALVRHLATPGLEVRQMLTRVRASVMTDTGNRQTPWDNSSLTADFFFVPAAASAASPPTQAQPPPAAADPVELRFWESAERGNTAAEYEAYLRRYPAGAFAELARARVAALAARPPAGAGPGSAAPPAQQATNAPRTGAAEVPRPSAAAMMNGRWRGRITYADGRPGFTFVYTLSASGDGFAGRSTEPNTFADARVPALLADIRGRVLPNNEVRWVKTYDGTGGVSHSVDYAGWLDPRRAMITGTWSIDGQVGGRFELSRE